MSPVRTMPESSAVTMTVAGSLVHMCPVVDEVDLGTVEIIWRTNGETYELHSLAEYLRGWQDSRLSHEQITDRIRHDLSLAPQIELVSVETTWLTAGLEVSCSTSPIPAAVTP